LDFGTLHIGDFSLILGTFYFETLYFILDTLVFELVKQAAKVNQSNGQTVQWSKKNKEYSDLTNCKNVKRSNGQTVK